MPRNLSLSGLGMKPYASSNRQNVMLTCTEPAAVNCMLDAASVLLEPVTLRHQA